MEHQCPKARKILVALKCDLREDKEIQEKFGHFFFLNSFPKTETKLFCLKKLNPHNIQSLLKKGKNLLRNFQFHTWNVLL